MADLQSIQSSNVSNLMNGSASKPIASSNFQTTGQPKVSQQVEQNKAGMNQGKLPEAAGQQPGLSSEPIDSVKLDSLMTDLNSQLQKLQNYMKFERDEDSQNMVVFVKDSETDELIRQIPTQEFLAISKSISQYIEMRQQLSEKISPPVGLFTHETA
jgi:flagellar protein FlaG